MPNEIRHKKWWKIFLNRGSFWFLKKSWISRKQPFRSIFRKICPENVWQIYRRRPMPKCDFNELAKQLYFNHISAWVFSSKFAAYFHRAYSSCFAIAVSFCFMRASIARMRLPIFKIFSNFINFCPNCQIIGPFFTLISEKSYACPYFLE